MRGAALLLGLLCAGAQVACSHAAPAVRPDAGVALDSLRGVLAVTAAGPVDELTLTMPDRTTCRLLSAADSPLARAQGLEITVWGSSDPDGALRPNGTPGCGFRVVRFAVRAVSGLPAIDGILRQTSEGYHLELADGTRIPLAKVPATLRLRVNARVYWVGAPDELPSLYGFLTP